MYFVTDEDEEQALVDIRTLLDATKRERDNGRYSYFASIYPLGETEIVFLSRAAFDDAGDFSNWDVIVGDLTERFPLDVHVMKMGSWNHGFPELFAVSVLEEEEDGELYPNAAAYAVLDWIDRLSFNGIADEEDYFRRLEEEGGE